MQTSVYEPRKAWGIVIWLTALSTINFLDKVVFGMVAVPLMRDLQLTPSQYGLAAGSFFWLFSTSAALVGFVGNRVQTRWLLLGMAILWALVQYPMSLVSSLGALIALRVILGAGEAPGAGVWGHALYKWFPHEKRNLPLAVVNQGSIIGMVIAGLAVPFISRNWGWRTNFEVLAVASVVWGAGWMVFGREGTLQTQLPVRQGQQAPVQRIPYARLLLDTTIFTGFFAGFSAYWGLALGLTWLPSYLEKGLGFNAVQAGHMFSLVMVCSMPVVLTASAISQRMLSRGATSRTARVLLGNGCLAVGGLLFLSMPMLAVAPMAKVTVLALAAALPSVVFAVGPAITAEIVPDTQRSALMGISVAIATSAGMIAPVVMGKLLEGSMKTAPQQGFEQGFAICGVVMLIGALVSTLGGHPARSIKRLYGG
ncbi:MAG: MFS transporter [Acidovorax sp.]